MSHDGLLAPGVCSRGSCCGYQICTVAGSIVSRRTRSFLPWQGGLAASLFLLHIVLALDLERKRKSSMAFVGSGVCSLGTRRSLSREGGKRCGGRSFVVSSAPGRRMSVNMSSSVPRREDSESRRRVFLDDIPFSSFEVCKEQR